MDQNRDGFIDKNDLRDTFAALGTSVRVIFFVCVFLLFFKMLIICLVCVSL